MNDLLEDNSSSKQNQIDKGPVKTQVSQLDAQQVNIEPTHSALSKPGSQGQQLRQPSANTRKQHVSLKNSISSDKNLTNNSEVQIKAPNFLKSELMIIDEVPKNQPRYQQQIV